MTPVTLRRTAVITAVIPLSARLPRAGAHSGASHPSCDPPQAEGFPFFCSKMFLISHVGATGGRGEAEFLLSQLPPTACLAPPPRQHIKVCISPRFSRPPHGRCLSRLYHTLRKLASASVNISSAPVANVCLQPLCSVWTFFIFASPSLKARMEDVEVEIKQVPVLIAAARRAALPVGWLRKRLRNTATQTWVIRRTV